jgi:hypothetical protein
MYRISISDAVTFLPQLRFMKLAALVHRSIRCCLFKYLATIAEVPKATRERRYNLIKNLGAIPTINVGLESPRCSSRLYNYCYCDDSYLHQLASRRNSYHCLSLRPRDLSGDESTVSDSLPFLAIVQLSAGTRRQKRLVYSV